MTKQQQEWLDHYIDTGDAKEAVRLACGCKEESVKARASQMKKTMAVEIDKRLKETLGQDSIKMLKIISDLASNADNESVKLNAAKDWLDRAGYKPIDKTLDITPERQIDDIDQEIKELQEGIAKEEGTKLKVVK